jgi:predicted unusual protein kinase regulating ubiquinone biosynthesis (AarF/ABC1/UbiB family)
MGQVHRARLHSGEEVAVKVQHPRIREAVLADLGNASVLEGLANITFGKKYQAKELLEVVRTRFLEELDYSLERERMELFRSLHADDPRIRIPRVFAMCSSDTVLTTAFVRGMSFEEACAAPVELRAAFARTLWSFVFRGNLVGGKFNADPHPGNYFFHDDGGVTFIDFGCVQELPEAFHRGAVAWHHAAIARDEQAFARGVCTTMQTRGGELERRAVAFCRACFEPLFGSPFHMTRAFSAGLVDLAKDMTRAAQHADADEFVMMPPELLFMNRLQFGFYSILARLDVPVDYAAEEQAFLPPPQ